MKKKVSIILPCYNVEHYLPRAIESVLNQTHQDFELLVVIDGSPDNSKVIADEYALKDNRIKVFEKENGGLSDARNYGLERASGKFVYFMDSDDWIEPDLLEENLKILEDENLDFVIFGYIQDDEDAEENLIRSTPQLPKFQQLIKGNPIKLDSHHIGLMGYAWNKVYRRSFLDQHNFRFEKGISLVEDILFNAPVYSQSEIIRFNQKAYYHYFNRPVLTLMKKFYKNSFELKVKKSLALENFMENWNIVNRRKILAESLFAGIKYGINAIYSGKHQLTDKEKLYYLKEMSQHSRSKKILRNYKPYTLKDKVLYFLFENNIHPAFKLIKKFV